MSSRISSIGRGALVASLLGFGLPEGVAPASAQYVGTNQCTIANCSDAISVTVGPLPSFVRLDEIGEGTAAGPTEFPAPPGTLRSVAVVLTDSGCTASCSLSDYSDVVYSDDKGNFIDAASDSENVTPTLPPRPFNKFFVGETGLVQDLSSNFGLPGWPVRASRRD